MKKKSKLRTIFQALTSEIPVDEPWFQERLSACEGCEWNSDNVEQSELSFANKTKINLACSESSLCTACGCCLHEKLGQKTENCGLIGVAGEETKWRALSAETSSVKEINVEILEGSADSVDIDIAGKYFMIRVGNVKTVTKSIKLRINRPAGLKISKLKATCGCTVASYVQVNPETIEATIKIDTTAFTNNARFEKSLNVIYFEGSHVKTTTIKFIGKKTQ